MDIALVREIQSVGQFLEARRSLGQESEGYCMKMAEALNQQHPYQSYMHLLLCASR